MKLARILIVCSVAGIVPSAMAQKWEFGAGGGAGIYTHQDVSVSTTKAQASIATSFASDAWLANNTSEHWGGEIHFNYQIGDLQLKQNNVKATFGAGAFSTHYDFVYHTRPMGSHVRPFIAAGAGIKMYRGTGAEAIAQPLSQYALLTKQNDITPLVSVGVGVKVQVGTKLQFRFDVHDYMSTFPKGVITPNINASVAGWLHDFVPMVGLAYTY